MARPALDGFAQHYAETFWSLMPEIYRHEDGYADPPGQLRALCDILGSEAAIARRSIDRLLADSRIDEADDWALPYIARLLGTRLTSARNPAARRADIAHTIAYRRRAGTPHLLERLADDIADWDAVASEGFQRLARRWHMLDTAIPEGPITHTPRGGYARLNSVRVSDVLDGAFDDLAHRPQIRPPDAERGRLYEIAGVNLFVYRQYAFPLEGVTPFRLDAMHYTLDPSGRDVPLFQPGVEQAEPAPGQRFEDSFFCEPKREWSVRGPITCRRINAATYRLDDDPTYPPSWAPLIGQSFRDAQAIVEEAEAIGGLVIADLLDAALTADSPKANLVATAASATPALDLAVQPNALAPSLAPHALIGASLAGWADGITTGAWVTALADPARGRVQLRAAPPAGNSLQTRRHYYGIFWPVGAGTHDRRRTLPQANPAPAALGLAPAFATLAGDRLFADCRTYAPTTGAGGQIQVTGDTRLWSVDKARPYVRIAAPAGQRSISLIATGGARTIEIDGLWLGIALGTVAAPADLAELVLEGDWDQVTFRDVSLDPGGEQVVLPAAPAPVHIPHVRLVIDGTVATLALDRCIVGSIAERTGIAGGACSAARVTIRDSIVIAHASGPAIALGTAELTLQRSTVLGDLLCARAEISESIIDGDVFVENAQDSCFRYSAARSGGRIPAQYQSIIFPDGLPAETFVSRRFGDPGLAQLAPGCPQTIARGGEDGTEMGAFNRALDPIKHDDLAAKIAEYAPVQARVQILAVT
ncbi:hypothetical protein AB2M62_01355 [Sphingomonas sp. MMS12-HWE2-04]|uniref:hypothetical protein n=1 Tax=Sphingomonas sp. MMS12-HWE2-04 TaxID=3234199 RepID=UPI00384FC71D